MMDRFIIHSKDQGGKKSVNYHTFHMTFSSLLKQLKLLNAPNFTNSNKTQKSHSVIMLCKLSMGGKCSTFRKIFGDFSGWIMNEQPHDLKAPQISLYATSVNLLKYSSKLELQKVIVYLHYKKSKKTYLLICTFL